MLVLKFFVCLFKKAFLWLSEMSRMPLNNSGNGIVIFSCQESINDQYLQLCVSLDLTYMKTLYTCLICRENTARAS